LQRLDHLSFTSQEKFNEELAKKLTKLKRYRENVIAWATNRDAKDRVNELEAMRFEIEARMEAHRAMEKEDKIKPFSEKALEMEPKVSFIEKDAFIKSWYRYENLVKSGFLNWVGKNPALTFQKFI